MRRKRLTRALGAALLTAAVGPLGVAATAHAATVTDDFTKGARDNTSVVTNGSDNAIELAAPFDSTFDGTTLPASWPRPTQRDTDGGATVGGGLLTVNGATVDTGIMAGPGSVLEFRATFNEAQEHIGFANNFDTGPWAIFSTGPDGAHIYIRTWGAPDVVVPGVALGETHDYRIVWTAGGFEYYVDGALVPAPNAGITGPVTVQASDLHTLTTVDANQVVEPVTVESLRLTNTPTTYAMSGTYTSGVLDAGSAAVTGIALQTAPAPPNGTSITYQTRTGTTSTPDGSWSDWADLGAGGSVASPTRRYLQYRATLATTDSTVTPVLSSAAFDFTIDTQGPTASVTNIAVNGTSATATFTSDDSAATYQCSLDNGAFSNCTSPFTYSGLAPGTHTFSVRGTDLYGNVGQVASTQFTIASPPSGGSGKPGGGPKPDTTAPKLIITPKSLRISKTGSVTLKVKCPKTEKSCKVTLRLKRNGKTIAKRTITIRGGKTVSVSLKLPASIRALLAKRTSLTVTAAGTATDAAGNTRTTSTRITLKPAITRH